jgi:hypothetical protein
MTADRHRHHDLVEPEGVNADPTTSYEPDYDGDVREGGDPDGPRPDPRADESPVVQPPWDPDRNQPGSSVDWYAEEGAE